MNLSKKLAITSQIYQLHEQRIQIKYRIIFSSLGYILIANTDQGICTISLGDHCEELIASLAKDFSQATIIRDDENHQDWSEQIHQQIHSYLAGKEFNLDFPLVLRGTDFQLQVWQTLQRIPYGETRTYGEVARDLGKPKATRAIGNACGANRIALIIPCHRVVSSDGTFGNYRWGIERKQKLIKTEILKDNQN